MGLVKAGRRRSRESDAHEPLLLKRLENLVTFDYIEALVIFLISNATCLTFLHTAFSNEA